MITTKYENMITKYFIVNFLYIIKYYNYYNLITHYSVGKNK